MGGCWRVVPGGWGKYGVVEGGKCFGFDEWLPEIEGLFFGLIGE